MPGVGTGSDARRHSKNLLPAHARDVLDDGAMPNARRTRSPGPGPAESGEDTLPTLYVKPGEADRILAGHPWIYESSVLRHTRDPVDGDAVQVKDHRRRFLGVGFYNSKSRIRVRVLGLERRELDDQFFEGRLNEAIAHRRRFLPEATSFRVVNAEGDRLSGLIIDKYEDVLVIQTSSLAMDRRKPLFVRLLQKLLSPRAILERNDMGSRRFEGLPEASGLLAGELSESEQAALPVRLNGLEFEVNLQAGHKTGLYLDQQTNHQLVAGLVPGLPRTATVLDAFSFIGGFGLHAARAGAASVVGIDQSEEATRVAQRLAETNGLANRCTFETANVFDWLRTHTAAATPQTETPPAPSFDMVILDPPSFTRNRAAVPDALRGYKEIHLRGLKLLRPGGILATFCCSHHVDARTFETVIQDAARDARCLLRRIAIYQQSADHPILPAIPESEYLKGFAFELLSA